MRLYHFFKGMFLGAMFLTFWIGFNQYSPVRATDECLPEECQQSPIPSPVIFTLDVGQDGPHCSQNHFNASAHVKRNGVPQSGVEVTFQYKAETKKSTHKYSRDC